MHQIRRPTFPNKLLRITVAWTCRRPKWMQRSADNEVGSEVSSPTTHRYDKGILIEFPFVRHQKSSGIIPRDTDDTLARRPKFSEAAWKRNFGGPFLLNQTRRFSYSWRVLGELWPWCNSICEPKNCLPRLGQSRIKIEFELCVKNRLESVKGIFMID